MSWNSDSRRLTSTTWPTPEWRATIVAKAATIPVTSSAKRDRREQRRPLGLAVDGGQARHGLGQRGEARGGTAYGTVLAEAGDPGDDQVGVAGQEDVGAETEAFEGAGPEVLDQHIGPVEQGQHRLPSLVVLEVEHDRPLAAPEQLPEEGDAVAGVPPAHRARRVPRLGALHLDDVRAEVGQVAGTARAGQHRGAVHDPQARQRLGPGRVPHAAPAAAMLSWSSAPSTPRATQSARRSPAAHESSVGTISTKANSVPGPAGSPV